MVVFSDSMIGGMVCALDSGAPVDPWKPPAAGKMSLGIVLAWLLPVRHITYNNTKSYALSTGAVSQSFRLPMRTNRSLSG